MPKQFILVAALLIASAASLSAPAQAPALPEEFRFATGLYKQQRWDLAADAFKKFLEKYPRHERVAYARLYRGLALVNADRFADARDVLRGYAVDYPQNKSLPDVLYRVAECSYLLDDLKAAETEFDRFLKQYPQHELAEWALPYQADAKLRLKKPAEARQLFKESLAHFPKSRLAEDARFGLARAYEDLKQPAEAAALYAQLADAKDSSRAAQSIMSLATIQFGAGRYEDAAKSFLRLAENFPKSPLVGAARLNAGFSLYKLGHFERAINEFDHAAADKRQAAAAGYWKGISYKALGDYTNARQVLKAAYEANPQSTVAESALFYWADCELRSRRYDAAKRLFLEVVRQWPKGEFADDSLHFAAEAALAAGSADEADRLVQRFVKEYPDSPLALHEEVLLARVLNAKAAALLTPSAGGDAAKNRELARASRKAAVEHLEKVVAASRLPRTIALARFYLGRTLQDAGEHARVIEALAPLVEKADQTEAPSEAVEALVIAGRSLQALGQHEAAVAMFSQYVALRPKGEQLEQALSQRAVSNARLGRREAATSDVALLLSRFPNSSAGADTLRRMAELAYDAKEWPAAAELFSKLAEQSPAESEARRMGLSGLGWAKFQLKSYGVSAAAFRQVFERFSPRILQVAEAGYMQGLALEKEGKLAEAAAAYKRAFERLAPASSAGQGDDARGPAQYGFLAGVQAASVLAQLKRYDDSDAAYRLVVDRFAKSQKLGQVLFDWANMLYVVKKDGKQLQRVREILAQVVRDYPGSSSHHSARLFLAELDLAEGKSAEAGTELRSLFADPKADAKVREESLIRLIELSVDKEDWKNVRELADKFLAQFSKSVDAPKVRLHLAAAQLGLKEAAVAEKTLAALKQEIAADKAPAALWHARVWILLAEALWQQQKYAGVQTTVDELRRRMPRSELLYQADEILGRTFKQQAQWDKAIAAFQHVVSERQDEQNETAAKAQLMIAECRFFQKNFRQAREDYLKVYTLYDRLPEWGVLALFQVGQCEEALGQLGEAEKTYTQLIATFPRSDNAEKAKERLEALKQRRKAEGERLKEETNDGNHKNTDRRLHGQTK